MRTPSRILSLCAVLLLVALPGLAQKAFIDYDKSANLAGYKTYAFVPNPGADLSQSSPLMHKRVLDGIRAQIKLQEVPSNPDLAVTYHVTTKQEVSLNTTGMSYGPRWGGGYRYYGGGWGSTTTTVDTYEVGTLVIDVADVAKKQVIWRGTVQGTVPTNPEKGAKKIDKAIEKLAAKWVSMRGNP